MAQELKAKNGVDEGLAECLNFEFTVDFFSSLFYFGELFCPIGDALSVLVQVDEVRPGLPPGTCR